MEKTLSTVFHEVRNPLGVINLHAELIKKNPERAAYSAEIISRTSLELERILTEFMDFSKPMVVEKKEENVEKMLVDLKNLINPMFERKNVELVLENQVKEKLSAQIDKTKFNQALFNILKNALEVSKRGDKVEISLEKQKRNIYIKISDNGPGISPENREKLFNPYFTTKKQGNGIGLATSKKIVEQHNGNLYIDTEKTNGTTFIIRINGG